MQIPLNPYFNKSRLYFPTIGTSFNIKLKTVMNKHKSNKIKENSNTVRHLIMRQITTTQNLVAIKEVWHAGQTRGHTGSESDSSGNNDLSNMAELPSFSPPASESTLQYRTSPPRQARMRPKAQSCSRVHIVNGNYRSLVISVLCNSCVITKSLVL